MKKIFVIFAVAFLTKSFAQAPNWVLFNHTNAPFVNDSITWVEVDTNNVKWVGTQNGLYSFYNNAWTVYNTSNSNIPSNRIDKFKIAYDNTIWFLNHNNGFIKFKNNAFTLYNKANTPTMRTDSLVGLTIDNNEVYFWSRYDGIVRFNGLTNTVYNIDTTNSYLKNIVSLIYHQNHSLYGLAATNISSYAYGYLPQNKTDSINFVTDFKIINTPIITIGYDFYSIANPSVYNSVSVDKAHNRYEIYNQSTVSGPQLLRIYDKNNSLISSNNSYDNYYQISTTSYGHYELIPGSADALHVTIFTPSSYNFYFIGNSIIPNLRIVNFDYDKYNNIWLATPSGFVGYNDTGVITNVKDEELSNLFIYPNPVIDILNIEFSTSLEPTEQPITIEMTNALGQIVLNETSIAHNLKLKTHNLQSGLYYITIKTKNKTVTRKIIKG